MLDAYDFWADRLPRADLIAIDDFWQRFAELGPRVERYARGRLPNIDIHAELQAALGGLRDRVRGEFEFARGGGLALAITPELFHTRRPLARAFLRRAPELRGWAIRDARSASTEIPDAVRAILHRSRSEALAVEELVARRGAHRLVDLVAQGFGDHDFIADQAGVIFAVLLGERADQDWLGASDGRRWPMLGLRNLLASRRQTRNDRWLSEFRTTARAIIEGFEAERPEKPFVEVPMRVEDCVDFRLRPVGGDPARRHDAMQVQSRHPALTAARLAGARIAGVRFSRFGEIFCGLKVMRTGSSSFAEVADIATFGARIEERLAERRCGGVIGRASGIRHVYVDLALTDIEAAIAVLRRALADEGVLGPAWLLFDEAGLEDRYLPLTAKTPETPQE
ncbi:hypothetical protein LNKW23_01620 [Paralimibaculum aggregatum]|uniref:Uncharacterized protein n=1 Tax=Paralimibaculum aggregatum TaxID=3036245 RepID=A0ABQ6LKY5_9RHOB|nr:hypothetical protein [Limibaculum sp. NKW23]GMG80950.1 hypothetical protein LNKW23_01620 [Limibaculum sp. NKW23]